MSQLLNKTILWLSSAAVAFCAAAIMGCGDDSEDESIDAAADSGTDDADSGADTDTDTETDTDTDTYAIPDGGVWDIPCGIEETTPIGADFFLDISDSSGIRDENFDPDPPVPVPINDHSRLGFADINGDGFDDIVMHSLFPNPLNADIPFEHLVFVNNGDNTFTNWSDESGLRDVQSGFFVFGDVDNDGDQDCFAGLDISLGDETHALLLNDGEGHFTRLANSGLEGEAGKTKVGNAVFADFDGDSYLDIYMGAGHTYYAAQDKLFMGNGDGTFEAAVSNLPNPGTQPSNGTVACDYDNDGDLDIFVSVYGVTTNKGKNLLWENDGTGSFENVALERGFASLATGNYWLISTEHGTMEEPDTTPENYIGSNGFGLECADINNDGFLDLFVTAISHPVESEYSKKWSDPTTVLINQGPDAAYSFVNRFLEKKLPFNEGDVDGAAVDFDNDGCIDLSMSRDSKYEGNYINDEQKGWFGLMHQQPDGTFESVGMTCGINDPEAEWNRLKGAQNHAWSDIDLDGDLDMLAGGRTGNVGRPNFLFENLVGSDKRWVGFRLQGDGDNINRDAIGARVTVIFEKRSLMREVKSSRGMHTSMDMRALLFGLGGFAGEFQVKVDWPDGTTHTFEYEEITDRAYHTVVYPDSIAVD